MIDEQGLTLVGIAVGNLDDDALQLPLPFDRCQRQRTRHRLPDDVRDRFGAAAITRAGATRS